MKTMFTKIATFIAAFVFMVSASFSQGIVTTAPTLNVCPGSTNVAVPIVVQNFTGVASISLSLEYTPGAVSYVGYTSNPAFAGGFLMVNNTGTKIKAAYFSLSPVTLPDDAVIFTFTFNVTSSSPLIWDVVTQGDCQYSDFNGDPMPAVFINGAINAVLPDADFTSTPTVCEGEPATVTVDFTAGTAPFTIVYNDGVNPDVTVTTSDDPYTFQETISVPTTWTLVSISSGAGCSNPALNKTTTTDILPSLAAFNVSGGGVICAGEPGVSVLLDGSQSSVMYQLYLDAVPTGYILEGTGAAISFSDIAGAGNYTVAAYNSCGTLEMTGTAAVIVNPLPEVTLNEFTPVCEQSPAFTLTGGLPDGGTYSGTGVIDGFFYPEYTGPGDFPITYEYTDVNGCTNSAFQYIAVMPLPAIYFEMVYPQCENGDPVSLYATPEGGTFSGEGVVDGVFYPDLAGPGYHFVSYSFTDIYGCSNTASQEIQVNPIPVVTIDPVSNACIDGDAVMLAGIPAGGWFEGPGVYGEYFYPGDAGAGTWMLTYNYIDEAGCFNSASTEVTVFNLPVVSIEPVGPFCTDNGLVPLSGSPAGGVFYGDGVVGDSFDPGLLFGGIYTIYYEYLDANGCSATASTEVVVNPLPDVYLYPVGPLCADADPVALTAWPEGGTFSGVGVDAGVFYPALAGSGIFTITYTYTDVNGCTNMSSQEITVNPLADLTFTLDPSTVCISADPVLLTAEPAGGWYEGQGVYDNYFWPGFAGTGTWTITYHYTNQWGCMSMISQDITVLPLPVVEITPVDPLCADSDPVVLAGTPPDGIFEGAGVTDGVFYPEIAGTGYWYVTYTYTDPNGCTNIAETWIQVNPVPDVFFYPSDPICANSPAIELFAYPEGGVFEGPGIVGTTFDPALSGVGEFLLTYTYTHAETGCSASANSLIVVNPLPEVSFSFSSPVCFSNEPFLLTGTPAGGWFEGPAVSGNHLYPAEAGIYPVTYYYQDNNGCLSSAAQDIEVLPLPVVEIEPVGPQCENAGPVVLAGTPSGGMFEGNGVTDGVFYPQNAGAGTHMVTYTFTDPFGCTNSATTEIQVNPLPYVEFYLQESVCWPQEVQLAGYPEGGVFTGEGVADNHLFMSSLVTPGMSYTLTYTYTETTGCSNSASAVINVLEPPAVTLEPVADQCVNNDPVLLSGSPESGVYSGPGVIGEYFYPSFAGVGVFEVSYTFTDVNGCQNMASQQVVVNPQTEVIFGLAESICLTSAPITMSASPEGGIYAGTGVAGNVFDPALAGVGTFDITYTFINEFGCVTVVTETITVNTSVDVTFDPLADVCITVDAVSLYAYPEGGTFEGPGVAGNIFYPELAGEGTWTITYTLTIGDCTGSTSQTINVLPLNNETFDPIGPFCLTDGPVLLPVSAIDGYFTGNGVTDGFFYPDMAGVGDHVLTYIHNPEACYANSELIVTVLPMTEVSITEVAPLCANGDPVLLAGYPEGGDFSGPGVTGNMFHPTDVTPGIYTVFYAYDVEGCGGIASIDIEVLSLPDVNMYADYAVCSGSPANITVEIIDAGPGPWTLLLGNGMTVEATEPTGNVHVVHPTETYTYHVVSVTNAAGCTHVVNAEVTILVYPLPLVFNVGGSATVCADVTSVQITLDGSEPDVQYTLFLDGVSTGNAIWGDGSPLVFDVGAAAGEYTVMANTLDNCSAMMAGSAVIAINPALFADAGPDAAIIAGANTLLTGLAMGGTEPYTYSWTPADGLDDPFSQTPLASPAVTTLYTLMVTDGNNCVAVDQVLVTVQEIQDAIYGTLSYLNDLETPMNNCTVSLFKDGTEVASTLTDANGFYEFNDLELGTYTLFAQTLKPWGGGNSSDGLLMLKHFVGESFLSGLKYQAGDVTGNNVVNAHDALNTVRRFLQIIPDYAPLGDWVFENPTVILDGYSGGLTNFKALCRSDVNGDYLPPNIKPQPTVTLNTTGSVHPVNGQVTLPLFAQQSMTVGAVSLILDLPSGVTVSSVWMEKGNDNLQYNQTGNELRIGWYSLEALDLNAGDKLLTIRFADNQAADFALSVNSASTLADHNALTITNARLSSPAFNRIAAINMTSFPNPFQSATQIRYSVPGDGWVKLNVYNLLGEKVAELVNEVQTTGEYQMTFDGSSLNQGSYIYRLEFNSPQMSQTLNGMMNLTR